jgi:hypothetical protein
LRQLWAFFLAFHFSLSLIKKNEMPRKITFFLKSCTICTVDQKRIFFSKVVKKLSKGCQKVVKKFSKKLSKSCQKLPKSCQKLPKSCQKLPKKLSKSCQKSCQKNGKIEN